MRTYLISYDLMKPETHADYIPLINLLKSSNNWARPLMSVWLIKTTLTPMQIAAAIRKVTDANDRVLVIEVTKDWAGFGLSQQVINWLNS